MLTKTIYEKLEELNIPLDSFALGDYDAIGEFTARKARNKQDPLYATAGCFFRPNYERGILAAALIAKYRPQKILEIGFGRGYWVTCAAKAMYDAGIDGSIDSIDVNFDKNQIDKMSQLFPSEWLKLIQMHQGPSVQVIPQLPGEWDMIYIDGDHTLPGVTADWELIKNRFNQMVIFDDYHLPTKEFDPNIQVAKLVDELEGYDKELITLDRLIFQDDRPEYQSGQQKDYGQVILSNNLKVPEEKYVYDWE